MFLLWAVLALASFPAKAQEDFEGGENINDPSMAEEEGATGMENFGDENGNLEDEALAENEINPNEEEEINQEMQDQGLNEHSGMFGGGEDGELMGKMGLNPELNQAEQETEHDQENPEEEHETEEEVDPAVEQYFKEEEEAGHHQEDPNIEEEHLGEESEYNGDEEIPGDQIIDHGLIALEHHTELEKMKNFKKISDDCKVFLEEFRDCLDDIPDQAWEEKEIQKCVGKDFTRVVNNICKANLT